MVTGSHISASLISDIQTKHTSSGHLTSSKKRKKKKLQSQRKPESIPGYMADHIKDSYGALNQGATTSKLDAAVGNRVRSDIIYEYVTLSLEFSW